VIVVFVETKRLTANLNKNRKKKEENVRRKTDEKVFWNNKSKKHDE